MEPLRDAVDDARMYLDRALEEHAFKRLTIGEAAAALRQSLDELHRACGDSVSTASLPRVELPSGETPGDWVRADLAEARRITEWVLEQAKALHSPPGIEGAVSRLARWIADGFDRLDRTASGLE